MTTHKNLSFLGFGLGLVGLYFVLFAGSASAATPAQVKAATYTFQDAKTITATIAGKDYTFVDSDPADDIAQFELDKVPGTASPTGELCAGKIRLNGVPGLMGNNGTTQSDITNKKTTIVGRFFELGINGGNALICPPLGASSDFSKQIGNPSLAYAWFKWVNKNTMTLLGYSGGDPIPFTRGSGNHENVFYANSAPSPGNPDCRRQLVLKNNTKGWSFSGASFLPSPDWYSRKAGDFTVDRMSDSCPIYFINEQRLTDKNQSNKLAANTINIANVQDADKEPPAGGGGGGATGTDDACYQSGWALSWLACPVITAAQTAANAMYGFVEDQLKFCVSQSSTDTTSCRGGDSLGDQHDSVHSAWSNFRILASSLVVILLLVMVISQAIGTGPFDAYTIRKMLPRLVMGVILIQISWPVFSWVVNTVDHMGIGLADIMYAPFGGAKALDLNSVMAPFTAEAIAFSWVGIPALVVFGVVAPFIVIGLILAVLVAIFVGFLTLLFRKILIIMALIFVPVALISWMMPNDGLRKYWKLWWDNFIKALMMFPLIIAMIAAGRIFAKIGSGQSDFVGFFIVLVGFFGPLFILPKTFKWGGTIMQSAGSALSNAGQKGLKKPKEFLGERQKGYSAERTRQSQERYSKGEGFSWKAPWKRPIDLVKSGQADPTLLGRRRKQAMDSYVFKGVESEESDLKAANARAQLVINILDGKEQDEYAQMLAKGQKARIKDGKIVKDVSGRAEYDETTDIEKRAGLDQMLRLGGEGNMKAIHGIFETSMQSGDIGDRQEMNKFTTAHADTLFKKMPQIYKNSHYLETNDVEATVTGLGAGDMTQISAASLDTQWATLDRRRIDPTKTDVQQAEADTQQEHLLAVFHQALMDRNLRGNLSPAVLKTMRQKAALNPGGDYSADILNNINTDGVATPLP